MFEYMPDYDGVLSRYEAWWDCQVLDRPLVSLTCPRPPRERVASPRDPGHAARRDRWLDTEHWVASVQARMANTCFLGDALPVAYPNLGPDVFAAFYGCPLEFGDTTSWSMPVLGSLSPEAVSDLRLDTDGFWFRKLLEMTDAILEVARGRFIVGYTDLHPGADAVAALRDPQALCLDMLEEPAAVRDLVERVTDDFLEVYEIFHRCLSAAGMPSTSWLPAICRGRYHIPSNDFSCMVSTRMFEETFLPGIVRECRHMDRCIYHLDGPEALRYLDLLLEVPEIHAIQWVAGANRDYWADWIDVYRRIQARGKALCLSVPVADLDLLCATLRPEGVWVSVGGMADRAAADAVLQRLSRWRG